MENYEWFFQLAKDGPMVALIIGVGFYMLRRSDRQLEQRDTNFKAILDQRDIMFTTALDRMSTVVQENTRAMHDIDLTIAVLIDRRNSGIGGR